MIYVHEDAGTGETYFFEIDAGTAIWKMVDTFDGPLALEAARKKYPEAINHMPLGATGESDPKRAQGVQRMKRMDEYLTKSKGELRGILTCFEAALNTGANGSVRKALEELAQHHTDLENHIDGNG